MAIDWPTVGVTVLGSSVVAALMTQGITMFREYAKRKADGQAAALFCALSLEQFGSACAELVVDTTHFHGSGGVLGKAHAEIEAMPRFRDFTGLSALPIGVTSTLLEFEVSVEQANLSLQDAFADDHFELAMPLFLELGQKSFEIARHVRTKLGLPALTSRELNGSLQFLSEEGRAFAQSRPWL